MSSSSFAVAAHVALLQRFIVSRAAIVDRIEQLLNCQKKPIEFQQDAASLAQALKDCFHASLPTADYGLREQLEQAHAASGFKPRPNPGNDIIDATQLLIRGFHFWRQTRWPGQKGRVRYAQTLFNVYVLRSLTQLTLRLWDEDDAGAGARLALLQGILTSLWQSSPADQPVLVRDVRWLFPVAMSPTTDDLNGYFAVAARIATTLSEADQLEIQKAAVQTGAGHLRSQLRHLSMRQGVTPDDHDLVLITRISNALDISLLMEGLVTLLKAYQRAVGANAASQRLALAAAISEGISPDPALFVNRLDLLGPYTMIEHLFIAVDAAGTASYTPAGRRHLQLLAQYQQLIRSLATSLHEDCPQQAPPPGKYSPYGVLFGFSSNLLELAAFKTLQLDSEIRFSMEDAFTAGDADKLKWVSSWRDLPHIKPEVLKQFEYPLEFVDAMHARVEQALRIAAQGEVTYRAGKLHLADDADISIEPLSTRYIASSDARLVEAQQAEVKNQDDLLYCRLEGEFVVSFETAGGWVGITKDLLTEVLGEGRDARLTGLPASARNELRLMCPDLIADAG